MQFQVVGPGPAIGDRERCLEALERRALLPDSLAAGHLQEPCELLQDAERGERSVDQLHGAGPASAPEDGVHARSDGAEVEVSSEPAADQTFQRGIVGGQQRIDVHPVQAGCERVAWDGPRDVDARRPPERPSVEGGAQILE